MAVIATEAPYPKQATFGAFSKSCKFKQLYIAVLAA
jgi:hypothetical protein